jgi:hypothetical protein
MLTEGYLFGFSGLCDVAVRPLMPGVEPLALLGGSTPPRRAR